jgi:hypothetical protein
MKKQEDKVEERIKPRKIFSLVVYYLVYQLNQYIKFWFVFNNRGWYNKHFNSSVISMCIQSCDDMLNVIDILQPLIYSVLQPIFVSFFFVFFQCWFPTYDETKTGMQES